jgi:hypothetical protein
MTAIMAQRLIASKQPDLVLRGHAMARCAENTREAVRSALGDFAPKLAGYHCGDPICPRDRAATGKKNQRKKEALLASLPSDRRVYHVTLGTGVDDLDQGRADYVGAFASLRRLRVWDGIEGGWGQMEILRARGESRRWNLHAELMLWLRPGARIDHRSLREAWAEKMAERGLPGSFWLSPEVERRFVVGRSGEPFLPRGPVHEQARHRSVDGAGRRGPLGAGEGAEGREDRDQVRARGKHAVKSSEGKQEAMTS